MTNEGLAHPACEKRGLHNRTWVLGLEGWTGLALRECVEEGLLRNGFERGVIGCTEDEAGGVEILGVWAEEVWGATSNCVYKCKVSSLNSHMLYWW